MRPVHPLRRLAPALALLASLGPLGGCRCGAGEDPTAAPASSAAPVASAPGAEPPAEAETAGTAGPRAEPRFVGASQILVAYKGAELADKAVTRSKDDAKRRAEEALAKLKEGKTTFEELAKAYSDDPAKVVGGAVGNFERGAMPPAFADAAFALEIGETSGVVETPRGFHIIRRTR